MAHSCPECGSACYCGGDIDDLFFEGTRAEALCTCCDGKEESGFEGYDEEDPRECCPRCGKAFEEFGDLGCGYCDRRSPDFGIRP